MQGFLSPRLSLAEIAAVATIYGVFERSGWLPACGAAVGLGVLLSVGRFAARVDQ